MKQLSEFSTEFDANCLSSRSHYSQTCRLQLLHSFKALVAMSSTDGPSSSTGPKVEEQVQQSIQDDAAGGRQSAEAVYVAKEEV